MSGKTKENNESSQELKNLRAALAVNRGMELLDKIDTEFKLSTLEHHLAKRENHLSTLFERIHGDLFKDWQKQPGLSEPGGLVSAKARDRLREAVQKHLIPTPDSNVKGVNDTLFDSSGYVVGVEEDRKERREHCAKILAECYESLRKVNAFDYGNNLTRDFFMVALGKLPAFNAVYGDIDFRRLDKHDVRALHDKNSSTDELKKAFKHSLNPDRTPELLNKANGYDPWMQNFENIAHIRFLSHTDDDGKKYLVTMNGGLVKLDKELNKKLTSDLLSGKLLADIDSIDTAKIAGYLPGTESLREGYNENGVKYIDGFKTTKEKAPLFCLDVNILTGLRPSTHEKLLAMIKQANGGNPSLFSLNKNEPLKNDLLKIAGDDERLTRSVEIAYDHISQITEKLDNLKAGVFVGKEAVQDPKLFVCMGGAGVGKSNVEVIVKKQYGENKVVVSALDAFREKSDLHKVLVAAKHHADDYVIIEPFASALRDWVAEHARENKYNLLYDGSGITYQGRYAQLVDRFKESGFTPQVFAFDRDYMKAVKHVKSRYKEENRGVPWSVVAGKHSRMPSSIVQAIEDAQLDKFALFANDGKKIDVSLIAETFGLKDGELADLKQHQESGTLTGYLSSMIKNRPDSTLRGMAGPDGNIDELLQKIPTYNPNSENKNKQHDDHNTAYLSYTVKGKNRGLVIYDVERFIKVLDKGLINPYASSPENIHVPSESLAFLAGKPSWQKNINRKRNDTSNHVADR